MSITYRGLLPFAALFFLLSCSQMNPPVVVDETTTPTQEELYEQCQSLKGIGGLLVGETSLKQALLDPECNLHEQRSTFRGKGKWAISNDDERKWVEEKHPELARYSCSGGLLSSQRYMVGDFGLDDMYAVFYNGILAGVAYDCSSYKLYDLIADKYGKGTGRYHYFFQDNDPEVYPNYKRVQNILIDKTWENSKVQMKYFFSLDQKMGGENPNVSEEHHCIIWDKELLPLFEEKLQQAIIEFHNAQQSEKERTQSRL